MSHSAPVSTKETNIGTVSATGTVDATTSQTPLEGADGDATSVPVAEKPSATPSVPYRSLEQYLIMDEYDGAREDLDSIPPSIRRYEFMADIHAELATHDTVWSPMPGGKILRLRDPESGSLYVLKIAISSGEFEVYRKLSEMDAVMRSENLMHGEWMHQTLAHDGREMDRDYILMEHHPGDLLERMLSKDPVPFRQACEWGAQICAALETLHANRIIHRDIKPDNVLLHNGSGRAIVFDYNCAVILPSHTNGVNGTCFGSENFHPPEYIRGEIITPAYDIWCAGLVIWLMVFRDSWPVTEHRMRRGGMYSIRWPDEANRPHYSAIRELLRAMLALAPSDRPSAAQCRKSLLSIIERVWGV
jgi:serine/threonine protein kinase